MESDYYSYGQYVDIETLTNQQAIDFAKVVEKHHYAKLKKGIKINDQEGVELEVFPEMPQKPVANIRKNERICVIFSKDTNKQPSILALRKDFPENLQHLYLTRADEPKRLCLFEQDWRELKAHITPEIFLNRIFSWLGRAAIDEQHLNDQPLEPFLLSGDVVIYNQELFCKNFIDQVLLLNLLSKAPRHIYRIEAVSVNMDTKKFPKPPCQIALPIVTDIWHSRIINRQPVSIEQLNDLLKIVKVDLIELLQSKTIEIYHQKNHRIFLDYYWFIIIRLLKTRTEGGEVESIEDWAFFVNDTIGELGLKLGVIEKNNNVWAQYIGEPVPHDLNKSLISVARPVQALTRKNAKILAGVEEKLDDRICVIGAGALGSHIILNLARQGIGEWTIIDEDQILPHNHSRHALSPFFQGVSKAESLAGEINLLLNDEKAAKGITEDILEICKDENKLKSTFDNINHILDLSVSPAVSHTLALLNSNIPRSSVFLLQRGRFMVIISEGKNRKMRLDDLEVQLAIESIENEKLIGLFGSLSSDPIRYSGSCRDVTTVLAEDIVAIHSGIASNFLKNNMTNKLPSICIWKLSEKLDIHRINIKPSPVKVKKLGDKWEVRISQHALNLMEKYREQKLPKETGGVLLGDIDVLSHIIYIGGVLPSPLDSTEQSNTYIRGIKGLKKTVTDIKEKTSGSIIYVGEWHSHPPNCGIEPSIDDIKALGWLIEQMKEDGYPEVMIIQGDKSEFSVLLGQI